MRWNNRVPLSKSRSTAWRLVASHSITAAVGISLGALMMLQQDKSVAKQTKNSRVETNATVELVNQQAASDTQTGANQKRPESLATVGSLSMRDQHYSPPRPHRAARTAFRSGPLRAFGSIGNLDLLTQTGDFNSTQNSMQRNEGDDVDFSSEQIDNFPRDKPALSPGSLHLFLDDLTNLPTSDVPFCKAKGCQS